jgi:hypothetical protein
MGPKPLLLLDIDGVLNPWAAATCPAGYVEHDLFPDDDEPIRVADVHGAWIRDLATAYDIAWASGWGADCEVLARLLDLPAYPHVEFPPVPFQPADKVPAIAAFAGGRPCAWADDQHTPEAWTWARSRQAPTLLLPVDAAVGLTVENVAHLRAWAEHGVPPAHGSNEP